MKNYRCILIVFSLLLCGCLAVHSQNNSNKAELLVSAKWLSENLGDDRMVILHYGKIAEFEEGHIPGARLISSKDFMVNNQSGLRHELPDDQALEQTLRTWGINNNSRIVISYSDRNSLPMATRLFFTLDYAGLDNNISLLNGGQEAWSMENQPLSKLQIVYGHGNLDIHPNKDLVVTGDWLLSNLSNNEVHIVDARPVKQYTGTAQDHNSTRRGHIEGAQNIPFNTIINEDNGYLLKSLDELQLLFNDLKMNEKSTLITYCGSGIWASPIYFVARLLGYRVRFYDASFEEWGNNESLPVAVTVDK
ncbi:MAG: sulfurtransferase [Bacteroidales bacterium]|nr:sulfurtransferase [Bacteroidales bacterium]